MAASVQTNNPAANSGSGSGSGPGDGSGSVSSYDLKKDVIDKLSSPTNKFTVFDNDRLTQLDGRAINVNNISVIDPVKTQTLDISALSTHTNINITLPDGLVCTIYYVPRQDYDNLLIKNDFINIDIKKNKGVSVVNKAIIEGIQNGKNIEINKDGKIQEIKDYSLIFKILNITEDAEKATFQLNTNEKLKSIKQFVENMKNGKKVLLSSEDGDFIELSDDEYRKDENKIKIKDEKITEITKDNLEQTIIDLVKIYGYFKFRTHLVTNNVSGINTDTELPNQLKPDLFNLSNLSQYLRDNYFPFFEKSPTDPTNFFKHINDFLIDNEGDKTKKLLLIDKTNIDNNDLDTILKNLIKFNISKALLSGTPDDFFNNSLSSDIEAKITLISEDNTIEQKEKKAKDYYYALINIDDNTNFVTFESLLSQLDKYMQEMSKLQYSPYVDLNSIVDVYKIYILNSSKDFNDKLSKIPTINALESLTDDQKLELKNKLTISIGLLEKSVISIFIKDDSSEYELEDINKRLIEKPVEVCFELLKENYKNINTIQAADGTSLIEINDLPDFPDSYSGNFSDINSILERQRAGLKTEYDSMNLSKYNDSNPIKIQECIDEGLFTKIKEVIRFSIDIALNIAIIFKHHRENADFNQLIGFMNEVLSNMLVITSFIGEISDIEDVDNESIQYIQLAYDNIEDAKKAVAFLQNKINATP